MTHVAVLFTNYGPYHLARLDGFHQQCQTLGWRTTAIELARSEATYAWRASIENLPYSFATVVNDQELEKIPLRQLVTQLYATLDRLKPDAIAIAGYARPSTLAALAWCKWHRKPAILLSATKEDDIVRRTWQERIKRLILAQYQGALVGGKPQKRYLEKLGMPSERIAVGYNVVGNSEFHPDQIRSLPKPIQKPFFLAVNRFVPKKNLSNLITAYASYCQTLETEAWDLVLCGDGPLRESLDKQIQSLGLRDRIHLPGFLQLADLLPYYAHAGCFIQASLQEQWGLVVNEAMAAGLPILVSNRCGCYEDLVLEGINGFGFDPENLDQMTALMLKFNSSATDLEAMGQASLRHIQNYSPRFFAQSLSQVVKDALALK